MMASKKMNTYESWASEISTLTGKAVTRQAVDNRMNTTTHFLLKKLMEEKLTASIAQSNLKAKQEVVTSKFRSITIEDSTTLSLPAELSATFPGNVSKGKRKSQAKIHALYNFTANAFSLFDIHSYSQNDQSLASHSLPNLECGDLLLRDMEFFKIAVLKKFNADGIQFITRKTANVKVYDVATGVELNLVKQLRKNGYWDEDVLVGIDEQPKLRLVITPLPATQAAERRRKAKQDRDKRLNHSKGYYTLLGYAIYLTNIGEIARQNREKGCACL